jgi:hypothetical protein
VTVASLYFAPTYFTQTYFFVLTLEPVPGPPAGSQGLAAFGDADAYRAILSALEASGAFEAVLFGVPPDRLTLGGAATPLVSLVPEAWEEFDDVDPTAILRRVSFGLHLLVRDDNPVERQAILSRLEQTAHGALEGSGLGGCLPALTRLRRMRYDPRSLHPEQVARIDGEFTYILGLSTLPGANP